MYRLRVNKLELELELTLRRLYQAKGSAVDTWLGFGRGPYQKELQRKLRPRSASEGGGESQTVSAAIAVHESLGCGAGHKSKRRATNRRQQNDGKAALV